MLLALGAALIAAGCSTIDKTYPTRSYAINVGQTSLREDVVLLNMVRASRHEPFLFMSLSEYNGTGTLEAGMQMTHNTGIFYEVLNKGPVAAGTQISSSFLRDIFVPNVKSNAGNSFKLAPLETAEFYQGFYAPIDMKRLHLLMHSGIPREIVLRSIIKSVRVHLANGKAYTFTNEPWFDSMQGFRGPATYKDCEHLMEPFDRHSLRRSPFTDARWSGSNEFACNYQKFTFFMNLALEFGMVTEVPIVIKDLAAADAAGPADAAKKGGAAEPKKDAGSGAGSGKAEDLAPEVCYDAAVALEHGRKVDRTVACGIPRATVQRPPPTYSHLNSRIRLIQPIVRSPFEVFQFYGLMISSGTTERVRLYDQGSSRLATHDDHLLTITTERRECFASISYGDTHYCVPAEGANNSKRVFQLLNLLVTLNVQRKDLPAASATVVAP